MDKQTEVLIIGAGVIGVCTAYSLTEHGYAPLLIDKQDVCAGSSYGNAGLIVPSHAFPLAVPGVLTQGMKWLLDQNSPLYIKPRVDADLLRWLWFFAASANETTVHQIVPVLLELNRASMALYRELASDPQVGATFHRRGGLYLFTRRRGFDALVEEIAYLRSLGVDAALLDADGVGSMGLNVTSRVVGGVFFPEDAHLAPDRFVKALAERAMARGAQIQPDTEVLGFETSGNRITGVITTRGRIHADQIVLAAGAWSASLARQLGLRIPVQPAKGYSITVQRPADFPEIPLHLVEGKVAVTPMGDRLRFAGTLELAGVDLSLNRRRVRAIAGAVRAHLNVDPDAGLIEIWRGLRPLSPDTLPLLGRSPRFENLVLATGHGMLGMSLGPISGKLTSEVIRGARTSLDLTPLRPERFL